MEYIRKPVKRISERVILKQVLLEASKLGCRVFRNETGLFELKNGAWLSAGLCVGSSDIIGLAPDGRFLAIEVKAKGGTLSKEQRAFLSMVNNRGGIAFVCNDVANLKKLLDDAMKT